MVMTGQPVPLAVSEVSRPQDDTASRQGISHWLLTAAAQYSHAGLHWLADPAVASAAARPITAVESERGSAYPGRLAPQLAHLRTLDEPLVVCTPALQAEGDELRTEPIAQLRAGPPGPPDEAKRPR